FYKIGWWVFEIESGFSSLTAYITNKNLGPLERKNNRSSEIIYIYIYTTPHLLMRTNIIMPSLKYSNKSHNSHFFLYIFSHQHSNKITIHGGMVEYSEFIYGKVLVKELAQTLERQFAGYAESQAVGMVINTMEWIEGLGYKLQLQAIDTFNVNVVLVLGQEKLCSMLKDVLKSKPDVDVVKLQKSGGVVSRNSKVRQKSRSYRIREYFYGVENDLLPHSNIANFSDLSVYKIGGVPIGAEPAADPTRLVPVNINRDLLHLVLAVSFAKEPEQIISSNVAGFIYITDINIDRKKITYLAPSARQLPSRFLIMGTLTWIET
ncbi:hypothetical protein LOK49_LG07G02865, partial [Camellia lanceoleosa]